MIGTVGNHLLMKMNGLNHVQKNSNTLSLRHAVSYFQMKQEEKKAYMEMNLLLE